MEYSYEIFIFLFGIAVLAGFLDTLAGGGGLLTIPALVLSGMPVLTALGTNKLQGSFGTATASYLLFRKKKISWREIKGVAVSAFIGAVIGTITIQYFDVSSLSYVVPIVLVVISGYFLLFPYFTMIKREKPVSDSLYKNLVVPLIGFYDGMFGPGTGSFFSFAGLSLRSQSLIQATCTAKPLNFSTNIASLSIFILLDQIYWLIGGIMILGQMIGAFFASHYLFKINHTFLRIIVVSVCLLMLGRFIYANWIS